MSRGYRRGDSPPSSSKREDFPIDRSILAAERQMAIYDPVRHGQGAPPSLHPSADAGNPGTNTMLESPLSKYTQR